MKTLNALLAIALVTGLSACEPSSKEQDSKEVAKEANAEIFDVKDEEKDADFIVNTISDSYAQIKLAQLALGKSTHESVKKLAAKIETDHKRIVDDLSTLAEDRGVVVPTEETENAQKEYAKLEEKDTKNFNENWCNALKNDHEKFLKRFESRLGKTEDPELKNWIASVTPNLEIHVSELKSTKERVK